MKNEKLNTKNKMVILAVSLAVLITGYAYIAITKSSPTKLTIQKNLALHRELQTIYDELPTEAGKKNFMKQSHNLTQKVDPELVDLDSQIITCGANVDSLLSSNPSYEGSCVAKGGNLSSVKGKFLGGQCCGTLMDTKERHENLEKLQAYKDMPDIPLDPMHTPIEMAKKWIDYDKSTTLTPGEQKTYDEAYALSKEKPCCCKCWHYFVDEGIAKKMIKDGKYNARQIADFWDASEICGV